MLDLKDRLKQYLDAFKSRRCHNLTDEDIPTPAGEAISRPLAGVSPSGKGGASMNICGGKSVYRAPSQSSSSSSGEDEGDGEAVSHRGATPSDQLLGRPTEGKAAEQMHHFLTSSSPRNSDHSLTSLHHAYLIDPGRKSVEALSGSGTERGSGAPPQSRPGRIRARGHLRTGPLGAPPPDTSVSVAGPLERRMEQEQATLKWSIKVTHPHVCHVLSINLLIPSCINSPIKVGMTCPGDLLMSLAT